MKFIVSILAILILLLNCEGQKEEEVKVALTYNHEQMRQRSIRTPIVVSKHTIDVKDYNYKHIYDSTELDSSTLTGTVEVPVNVNLEVEYKNYTLEQPQIHYESGISSPFIVTHNSPPTTTVTISVAINPDYPVQETETVDNETTECTENCIVDNSTIVDNVTYTDNATWSDNFTYNTKPTQNQKTVWENFWDNISTSDNWSYVSVGHINDVTFSCDNNSIVTQIITQIQNDNTTNWNTVCDNVTWVTGGCGQGIELKATVENNRTGDCRCATISDNTTTIRPAINNKNWGGVGKSCSASSQSLEVILKK